MRRLLALLLGCAISISAASAQVVRQATSLHETFTTAAAIDDAGTTAFSISDSDPFATNPGKVPQVFRWDLATGMGTQITNFPGGVQRVDWYPSYLSFGPSVTDDGQTVVFLKDDRLVRTNADGTGLVELTPIPAEIRHFQVAGNGSRVVFDSTGNLTGANPGGYLQMFVVEADGTGLRQLTSTSISAWDSLWPSISDDGQRIAYFTSEGTADGKRQIAGILQDGTGFRWITSYTNLQAQLGQISGNGQSVAFYSSGSFPVWWGCSGGEQINLVEWDGTGLKSLHAPCRGAGGGSSTGIPDITDDALTVYCGEFHDGYSDIYRIDRDRSGWEFGGITRVGFEPSPHASCFYFARVAGGGSRATFTCDGGAPWGEPNADLSNEVYVADTNGTNHRQLSNTVTGETTEPDLAAAAGRIVFVSSANPAGEPGILGTQLYRMAPSGANLARITSLTGTPPSQPSVSDDGVWIAFTRGRDTTDARVYTVRDDGSALTELASVDWVTRSCRQPHMASDGSVVVFQCYGDILREGVWQGYRIYRSNRDGTGLGRVSALASDGAQHPRLDATRTWVVYSRAHKIRRTRLDGTDDQLLTTLGVSDRPDPTSGAALIVYQSTANPAGTNPEGNTEIFLWEAATGTSRQLTTTVAGDNVTPRISRDGQWVTFWSDAPWFGIPYVVGNFEPYRLEVATGRVERIGGLAGCAAFFDYYRASAFADDPPPVPLDPNGVLAAHAWPGDCAGANPDGNSELFVIDRLAAPRLSVSAGPEPTVVTWDVDPRYRSYDVVRGDVASLGFHGDSSVNLGAVYCVENDSLDANTKGSPDPDTPVPGQAFFYLHRGTPGPSAGPGSYGRGSAGGERTPSGGGCAD